MSGSRLVDLLRKELVLQPGNTGFLFGRNRELEDEMVRLSIYPVRNELLPLDFVAMEIYDPFTLITVFYLLRTGCSGVIKMEDRLRNEIIKGIDAWKEQGILTYKIEEPYIIFRKQRKPDEI